jgi:hypothetical protein
MRAFGWIAATGALLGACGGDNSPSQVESPGATPSAKTRVLEAGSAVLQDKDPVRALDVYLDGFHFANHDLQAQMEAHHYCSVLDEDVRQCVIFDGNTREAKLVGIEYVVSRRVFEQLPAEERRLWHSHVYEVKSGTLIAPGIPEAAEHALMEQLVGTYGKTWHTWHADAGDNLPLGHPMLMAGFTADGQLDPALVEARDDRMAVSTDAKREARSSVPAPAIVEGADAWQRGEALQLELRPAQPAAPAPEAKVEPDRDSRTESALPTRRLRPQRSLQIYAAVPGRDDG